MEKNILEKNYKIFLERKKIKEKDRMRE